MEIEKKFIMEALLEDKVNITMRAWYKLPTKVPSESIDARKEGNKLFSKGSHNSQVHEKIWKLYALSIAKAPPESEDLAAAFSNRSVLLMHLKKYKESIVDIDRALQITNSNSLRVKLLCRKTECFNVLGIGNKNVTLEKAKYWLHKVLDEKEKKLLLKMIEKVEEKVSSYLTNYNSSIQEEQVLKNLSLDNYSENCNKGTQIIQKILQEKELADPFELVSLKYSNKFGRHLVANRDIKTGEIIMVEKPYVTALNLKNFHAFCGYCLKTCWTSIPCDYCTWCMFCSEECKMQAWEKFHYIECSVIPYIKFDMTSDYWKQLALRLTIMAIREAGGIHNLKDEMKKIDNCKDKLQRGFINGKLHNDKFQSIYSLSGSVSAEALKIHIDHAVLTLIVLAKSTDLFGEDVMFKVQNDLLSNEDVLFVGSVLLRFLKISDMNAHCMMEGSSVCRFSNSSSQCGKNRCCEKGACIAAIPSFMNHSCSPNIRKCFTEDSQLMIYALQPIKQNTQIFDCYTGIYFDTPYSQRQIYLREFNFHCECIACEDNWPVVNDEQNNTENKKALPTAINTLYKTHAEKSTGLEMELLEKHAKINSYKFGQNIDCDLSMIESLSRDIDQAATELIQPSYATVILISTLWTLYDLLYGIRLEVPDKCN